MNWGDVSKSNDPRGWTGDAGASVDDVVIAAGITTPLLVWAGNPTKPSELVIHVGFGSTASAAEQTRMYDEGIALVVQWDLGRAHYETTVDLRGPVAFVLTANAVRLRVVSTAALATRVSASISDRAGASTPGGQPRRTQRITVPTATTESVDLPSFAESVIVAPVSQVSTTFAITMLDGNNVDAGYAERTSNDPATPIVLPAGTRSIAVRHTSPGSVDVLVIALLAM